MNMEPQIGESTQVVLGGFEIEGFRTISNEYALCIADASAILSLSIEQFRRKALKLIKSKYVEFDLAYECNGWAVTVDAITVSVFNAFVYSLSKENYRPALNLLESMFPDFISSEPAATIGRIERKGSPEKEVQRRLSFREKGKMEIPCPAGIIDIITETEVIEVKKASDWKAAVGQVLAYGAYYPSLRKRIHLFSGVSSSMRKIIVDHCSTWGILATFED